MNERLKTDIVLVIRKNTELADCRCIDLATEIANMVDKDFAKALMESMEYGQLLDACGMEIRSKT